jgi:hypothetical protein
MEMPQFQQSATISHTRTDIGARHSGQGHISTSPSSQKPLAAPPADLTLFPLAGSAGVGSGAVEAKSKVGIASLTCESNGRLPAGTQSNGACSRPGPRGPKSNSKSEF